MRVFIIGMILIIAGSIAILFFAPSSVPSAKRQTVPVLGSFTPTSSSKPSVPQKSVPPAETLPEADSHRPSSPPPSPPSSANQTPLEAPPSPTPVSAPVYDRRELERAIFDEINRVRLINDRDALSLRKDVARAGRKYAKELAADARAKPSYDPSAAVIDLHHRGGRFGDTVVERLAYKGVDDVARAGENIISLPVDVVRPDGRHDVLSLSEVAQRTVQHWLLSPTHRANMLTTEYTAGGVGIYQQDGVVVAVSIFIVPAQCGYRHGPCCDTEPACFTGYVCDDDREEPECRRE